MFCRLFCTAHVLFIELDFMKIHYHRITRSGTFSVYSKLIHRAARAFENNNLSVKDFLIRSYDTARIYIGGIFAWQSVSISLQIAADTKRILVSDIISLFQTD